MPPEKPNGDLSHYSVFLKTMEGGRQFTQRFEVYPPRTSFAARGLNQNQPYSFWVSAATAVGEGPESSVASEAPQTPAPARLASFSQVVLAAVREDVALACEAVGRPEPDRSWTIK